MRAGLIFLTTLILGALIFSGCTTTPQNTGKVTIVTTLFPLYEFAKEVGGDKVEVTLLLPPGAEAHTYEPKPSDIIKINEADVFLYVGAGMEPWAQDIVEGTNNKKLILIDASSNVTLLKSDEHEEHSYEQEGEAHAFEWVGVFELTAGTYKWSFAKIDDEYADPAMKMVILKSEDIESIEPKAEELMKSENQETKNDEDILTVNEVTYLLNFEETKETTIFTINITEDGKYVFFTEHMPTEFESKEHFFKDTTGNDIEPIMTEPESEQDHHHGEYDPHIWLDFSNDEKIVLAIAQTLTQIDSNNKNYYEINANAYVDKLKKLDLAYSSSLADCTHNEFITGGHNAFSYLAHKYNLESISALGISPNSEPTPKKIKEIVDLTKEHNIKYIFFEKLVNPKMAETIAQEANAKTLVLNPAHNLLKEQFDSNVSFIDLMNENLVNLKTGLECS